MDLLGRSGLVHRLVPQCMERPLGTRGTRDLPVVVLVAPSGGGKTALLDELDVRCAHVPHARFDFDRVADVPPYVVAAALSLQLAKPHGQFGRLPFPRLMLGLEAVATSVDRDDWSGARAAMTALVADGWRPERSWREIGRWRDELRRAGVPVDGDPAADGFPGRLASQLSRRTHRATAVDWYRGRRGGGDAAEVLAELNWTAQRRHGDAGEADGVDELLCDALLSDLRWAFTRDGRAADRTRNCVVLLDNADTESGRAFLDVLVRLRHDNDMSIPDQCDPLVVVATSRREDLIALATGAPVPPRSERRAVQIPDRASYDDWAGSRPLPRTLPSWSYVVELRGLTEDEVITVVRSRKDASPTHVGSFLYCLTRGHPWAVRTVLDATRSAQRSDSKPVDLRSVLDLVTPSSATGQPNFGMTVAARAREHLLRDVPPDVVHHLMMGAAARDLEHTVSEQVGGSIMRSSMPDIAARLRAALVDSMWVTDDDVRRATLHPFLRRVLLHALAARPKADPDSWTAVHERMRDSYRARGDERQALYHDLALGNLAAVVQYLSTQLSGPNPQSWLDSLHAITLAPFRPVLSETPRETVEKLVASVPFEDARHEPVSWLVAAMWVANDPLGDPEETLERLIYEALRGLRWHAGLSFDAVLDEAAERRRRSRCHG